MEEDIGLVGRSSDGTGELMFDFPFQYGIGLDANGVAIALVNDLSHIQHRLGVAKLTNNLLRGCRILSRSVMVVSP